MLDTNALRGEIARNGMTQGQVAAKIGMSAYTFSKKIRHGGFGLDDAEKMIDLLHIQDPAAIFFGSKVTCEVTEEDSA
jgi:hypothetical protein